ncbi:MAG: PKD domain-containing protein [Bacteroidales bacterium]|nr:PKD domain-containing protein [Bacteroidales bacterium]
MKKIAFILALLLVAICGCKKEEPEQEYEYPDASFTITSSDGMRVFTEPVHYISYSSIIWEWGDGHVDYQHVYDAIADKNNAYGHHQYDSLGTYTITLTVEDSEGWTDSKSKTITLT